MPQGTCLYFYLKIDIIPLHLKKCTTRNQVASKNCEGPFICWENKIHHVHQLIVQYIYNNFLFYTGKCTIRLKTPVVTIANEKGSDSLTCTSHASMKLSSCEFSKGKNCDPSRSELQCSMQCSSNSIAIQPHRSTRN